jgi:hypothetical protein
MEIQRQIAEGQISPEDGHVKEQRILLPISGCGGKKTNDAEVLRAHPSHLTPVQDLGGTKLCLYTVVLQAGIQMDEDESNRARATMDTAGVLRCRTFQHIRMTAELRGENAEGQTKSPLLELLEIMSDEKIDIFLNSPDDSPAIVLDIMAVSDMIQRDIRVWSIATDSTIPFIFVETDSGKNEMIELMHQDNHFTLLLGTEKDDVTVVMSLKSILEKKDLFEKLTKCLGWDRSLTIAKVDTECRNITSPFLSSHKKTLLNMVTYIKHFFLWKSDFLDRKIWTMSLTHCPQFALEELAKIRQQKNWPGVTSSLTSSNLPEVMPANFTDMIDLVLPTAYGTEAGAITHSMRLAILVTIAYIMDGGDASHWDGAENVLTQGHTYMNTMPYPLGRKTEHPRGGDQSLLEKKKAPVHPDVQAFQLKTDGSITGQIFRKLIQGSSVEFETKAVTLLTALEHVLRLHQSRQVRCIQEILTNFDVFDVPTSLVTDATMVTEATMLKLWDMLHTSVPTYGTSDQREVIEWMQKHNLHVRMVHWYLPWRRESIIIFG